MKLEEALSQIAEIRAQIRRSEIFRGYRPVPMAITGLLAFLAAVLQATVFVPTDGAEFALFWVVFAAACATICAVDLLFVSALRGRRGFREQTLPVILQFAPALLTGGAITAILLRQEPSAVALLPGLWSIVFGLGVFASRPYLPRSVGSIAAFYILAGLAMLLTADQTAIPSPWGMGLTFGIGQAAVAWVLRADLEEATHGET